MKKIRINELARELEVKPGVILDLLPQLGVQEKKTHSSSVDEDVAIALRHRLQSEGVPEGGRAEPSDHGVHDEYQQPEERHEEMRHAARPSATLVAEEPVSPPIEAKHEIKREMKRAEPEPIRAPAPHLPPQIPIPPRVSTPAPAASETKPAERAPSFARPPIGAPLRPATVGAGAPSLPGTPVMPEVPAPHPPTPSTVTAHPTTAKAAAENPPAVEEKPRSLFQPLRPPLGAGTALHPPLATPGTPHPSSGMPSRPIAVPARPAPQQVRPGVTSSGPRQPMPETPRVTVPAVPVVPPPPTSQPPQQPVHAAPPVASAPSLAPSAVVLPAPRPTPPAGVTTPHVGGAQFLPGTPAPPRPAPARAPGSPTLTPGAPIAPRPQGTRQLAGQPAARPVVPPSADVLARLNSQARPRPQAPGAPRPGQPARTSGPTPGQPIFPRGPIRPGQQQMRGPSMPSPLGPPGARRQPQRPMHPTTPRSEPATVPTEQQRRHQAKPVRQGGRKREEQEGILRERAKRQVQAEPPPIDREITIAEGITVKELSEKLGVKANLVVKKLVEKKIFATINQTLDVKLAEELARDFGASTNQVSFEEESTQEIVLAEDAADQVRRAPVVTVMGHVDHGKTSLLDAIRKTRVALREAGGITQHIGAYTVEKNDRRIVFIDTPGHQAFTRMRARGAKVTDIVVLVVAADDGVMPQTLEAIDHAKAAAVPIVVAINKIDKPDAQIDRIKQQLSDRGLLAEDWGGDVVMVPVSAKTGQNLDLLLEMILLVADILDLKANPSRPALGTVLEAQLDKGRGPVATLLVRNGTLRNGDFFICGSGFSKVRAMFDDRGAAVREAEPSMPVEVVGFEDLPEVGDTFQVVTDTAKAQQIVRYRDLKAREVAMAKGARVATLSSLNQQFREGDLKELNLIIKADVGGTAEVLSETLQQLSTDKVRVRVLRSGVGAITEDDVLLASASEALIVGFNVKAERSAQAVAEQQKVEIRHHSIIYELMDEVKLAMTGLLDPVYREVLQGHAEVRQTFKISKVGTVAGCFVTDGLVRRDSQIRVKRDRDVIHTGKIEALKRFKNDASEVKNGLECGISLLNYNDVQEGDILEAFMVERILPTLPQTGS